MTEHEVFETRLRNALALHVANGPTEFDALEFARTVAAAEPRRRGRTGAIATALDAWRADRRPWWSILVPPAGRSPAARTAWVMAVAGLLMAALVSAVFVGSQLLRRTSELSVVRPSVALTLAAHHGGVLAVAWSPDGTRLATAGRDATARIWDATGEEQLGFATDDLEIIRRYARADMAYSPDGNRVAVGTKVYGAATGAELVALPGAVMAYSPDGARIAVAVDYGWVWRANVCDAATGDVLVAVPYRAGSRAAMAWSPDGSRVARTVADGIQLFDAATGDRQLSIASTTEVTNPAFLDAGTPQVADIAWSPDGTRVAGADRAGPARIWDAATGVEVATLRHSARAGVEAIAWSPDGTRLTTAGSDGTAKIWDAVTGAELATLTDHTLNLNLNDVAWSPDGSRIATASDDGTARVWQVGTALAPAPTPGATPSPRATPVALPPLVPEPLGEPTVSDAALGRITWQRYASEYGFLQLTGTSHGPVASGRNDNKLRWLGRDGRWEGLALPWPAPPLAWDGEELYTSGSGRPRQLSWDGDRWTVGDVLDVPDAVRPVEEVVSGPRGTIVFGGRRVGEESDAADVAIAPDGRHFVAAAPPPSNDWPFLLATTDGFVALYATDETKWDFGEFEPVPWFTADGAAWEPVASSSPFGEEARIYGVAGRDGRFVAVGHVGGSGGPWAAWVSDDAIAWERVLDLERRRDGSCDPTASFCPVGVAAGDAGWVIYSKDGSAWASTDGRTWEPIDGWPAVRGEGMAPPQVVLAGDTIVLVGYTDSDASDIVVGTIEP